MQRFARIRQRMVDEIALLAAPGNADLHLDAGPCGERLAQQLRPSRSCHWAMDSSGAAAWVAGHSIEQLPEGTPVHYARLRDFEGRGKAIQTVLDFAERHRLDQGEIEPAQAAPGEHLADLVLVDAPCSGSGTWRRNPEGRWRISPDRLDRLEEGGVGFARHHAEAAPVGQPCVARIALDDQKS